MNPTLLGVFVLAALFMTYKTLTGSDGLVALFGAVLWAVVWGASRAIYIPETGETIQSEPVATLGFFGVLLVGGFALADLLGDAKKFT